MLEAGGAQIAGKGSLFRPRGGTRAHAPGGKALKLRKGGRNGLLMGCAQTLVAKGGRKDRNALWCRTLEIEEDDAACAGACGQLAAGQRMTIAPESFKRFILRANFPSANSQKPGPLPHPLAGDGLLFRIVVVRPEMVSEVG